MEFTERNKRLLERHGPDLLLSCMAYDPGQGLYFHADGSLGYLFLCYPLVSVDERVVQQLQPLLSQNYPPNTILQISLWTSPDIETDLRLMQMMRAPGAGETMSDGRRAATALVRGRAAFLREHTHQPIDELLPARVRDIQIIISVKVPGRGALPLEIDAERVGRLKLTTAQILRTLGMAPLAIDPERYLRILGSMVNWQEHAAWRNQALIYDKARLLRDQVFDLDTTIQVDEGGLWVGPRRARTLCVKRYPEFVHLVQAAQFLGDLKTGSRGVRENVLITLNVLFPDSEPARAAMTAKKNAATWQSMGPLARYLPRLVKQREDFETVIEALDDGDRIVRAYLSFVLFADDEDAATSATSNLLTYYRELSYRLHEDRFLSLPIFLNALPGNADASAAERLCRYRSMPGRHAVQLMPAIGDWKGTGTPVMTLLSRNGQLMNIDLFDSPTNFSALVAAESGSGKSFFVNFLTTSYLSLGAEIYLIEVGRSFKNLCQILGGEHLEFTADSDLSLNPFSIIENYDEQADFLMAVLMGMASARGAITEYQESSLRQITRQLWDVHGKSLIIDQLAQRLLDHRDADAELDVRVNDLGVQLYPFTTRGEYGRWFNRPATVNFRSSFTVCELQELKGRRHLMKVVLVQTMAIVQRAMYLGNPGRRKLLIVDEGWDLITEGAEGHAIERGCRELRKHYGSAVLILQGVNDLYRTEVGAAIWENTANKFLLGQTPEAIDRLLKESRLAFGQGAAEMLKSVRTEPGVFSEIFVYTRAGAGIARFVVDRRTALLYSTDPRDKQALATRIQAGMRLEDAIEDVVQTEQRSMRQAS
jgi:conjugal transfer ATP-binding protein TraC